MVVGSFWHLLKTGGVYPVFSSSVVDTTCLGYHYGNFYYYYYLANTMLIFDYIFYKQRRFSPAVIFLL